MPSKFKYYFKDDLNKIEEMDYDPLSDPNWNCKQFIIEHVIYNKHARNNMKISYEKFQTILGEAMKYCEKNNPVLCIFNVDNNTEKIYDYRHGYIGEQLMLFDMKQVENNE